MRALLILGSLGVIGCSGAQKRVAPLSNAQRVRAEEEAKLEGFLHPAAAPQADAAPGAAPAYRKLMLGRMLLGGFPIDEVTRLAAQRAEEAIDQAALEARRGETDEALQLAASAGGEEALALVVATLLERRAPERALSLLEKQEPSSLRSVLLALTTHRLGRSDEAVKRLREHLYGAGNDPLAYQVLIQVFLDQGKLRLARLACQGGLQGSPKNADLKFLLGVVDGRMGRPVSARRAFEETVAGDPGHLGARVALTRESLARVDFDAAIEHSTIAYRLAPGDEEISLLFALALRARARCDEAERALEPWLSRSTNARFNMGVLQLRCKQDPVKAKLHFDAYIKRASPEVSHPVHPLLQEAELLIEAAS